ncbi:MAG: hypothetical protein MJ252_17775 [archaeon]|nr:hypothetical protein [archaeon]
MALSTMFIIDAILSGIGIILSIMYFAVLIMRKNEGSTTTLRYINFSFFFACVTLCSSYFLGQNDSDSSKSSNCKIQALLTTTGGFSGSFLIFSTCFAICLKYTCKELVEEHPSFFNYGLVFFTWICTIILDIASLITNEFAPNAYGYCMMAKPVLVNIYAYTILTMNIIALIFLIYVGVSVLISLRSLREKIIEGQYEMEKDKIMKAFKLFGRYFIIQFMSFLTFFIEMIIKPLLDSDGNAIKAWNVVVDLSYAAMGGVTILIFGKNEYVWDYYDKFCCGVEEEEEEDPMAKEIRLSATSEKVEDSLSGKIN